MQKAKLCKDQDKVLNLPETKISYSEYLKLWRHTFCSWNVVVLMATRIGKGMELRSKQNTKGNSAEKQLIT